MSLGRTILKNTAWLTVAEIVTTILIAVGGILVARYLGDARYGQYGFAASFAALFIIVSDFGFNLLFINEVAKDRSLLTRYFRQLFTMKIVLGVLHVALVALLIQFLNKNAEVKLIAIVIAAGLAVNALMSFSASVFRVVEQMQYEAIFRMLAGVGSLVVIFLMLGFQLSLLRFVQLNVAVNVLLLVTLVVFLRKRFVTFRLSIDWAQWKALLAKAWPLGLSVFFTTVYYYVDSVMLSLWKSDEIVGWYNADYKLLIIFLTFMNLYTSVLFPVLSRLLVNAKETAQRVLRISAKALTTLTIPLASGTTVLSVPLLRFLYGEQFVAGAPALRILVWTVVVMAIGSVYGYTVLAASKRTQYMRGFAFGALTNVVLNLFLIPWLSFVGAAIATVAAETAVFVYMYRVAKREIVDASFLPFVARPALCSIGMVLVLLLLPPFHVLIRIVIGIVVYGALLLMVRGVTRDEFGLLLSTVRANRTSSAAPEPLP